MLRAMPGVAYAEVLAERDGDAYTYMVVIWHFPLRSGKHLGAFFVLVKEGILFVPYDDADKVNGGVFNLDAIRMTDRETIRWNINRLESLYCVGKDALHDLEAFLLKQEKKNEWG